MARIRLATEQEREAARSLCEATERALAAFDRVWEREVKAWKSGKGYPVYWAREWADEKRDRYSIWWQRRRHSPGERAKREKAYVSAATKTEQEHYEQVTRRATLAFRQDSENP